MSNIVKAKYVFLDNNSNNPTKQTKAPENPETNIISNPSEDLYEIYSQREIILKEAREEALKIVSTAKRNAINEIAECKKKGYEEGYNAGKEIGKNKGYEIGKSEAIEQLEAKNNLILKEVAELLDLVEKEKEEIINKYEDNLSNLAIEIAEKILKQRIEAKSNVISGIIKNAIKDYKNTEWVKIYISSKDDTISIQADRDLINELNNISNNVKFDISEKLEIGTVIVETPDSLVDASINTQLKNLKEMVLSKNAV